MSIFLFIVYFIGLVRQFIADFFFSILFLKLSYFGFLAIIVSMSFGVGYIMNFSKFFSYFLLIFSIFFSIGILSLNNCYTVNEEIQCELSNLMKYAFIIGVIISLLIIFLFLIYGFKRNNVHAKLFSIGSLIILSAVVMNILVKNNIYKLMSVPGIFFFIYSFLIKSKKHE
jgi:hypothetical protein